MSESKVSRRRFLIGTGAVLAVGAVTYSGLTVLGSPEPEIVMPEETLGEPAMSNKILVAYASTAGATAGVAEAIGRMLAESGATVDVRPMREVEDLTPYRAVVAGSAIHGSKWLPEAMDFLRTQRDALARRPFAAFLTCMTLTMTNETYRRGVAGFLDPVRKIVRPVSEGLFAGALDCSKLKPFPDRLTLRAIVATHTWSEGDFRDWDAIRAWTDRTRPLLLQ